MLVATTPYVGELLGTPRRQAERLQASLSQGITMTLLVDPRSHEALGHLPDYLGSHVRVSVTALALGLAISLPLALVARNRPVLRSTLLGLASIVQTMPGLALLALFYPLLLALVGAREWFGVGFSGTRILAGGAGARALFDAAGAAQHRHRPAAASILP